MLNITTRLEILIVVVMCVSVILHQETGGSASGNWLRAALTRVAAAIGFAPGIDEPHREYKSSAASHLTSGSSTLCFPTFEIRLLAFGLQRLAPCPNPHFTSFLNV
jgi:hypothetical protein